MRPAAMHVLNKSYVCNACLPDNNSLAGLRSIGREPYQWRRNDMASGRERMRVEAGSGCVRGWALCVVVALTACGGGGGASEPAPESTVPPPVVPAALDIDQAVLLAGRVGNLGGLAGSVSGVSERLEDNFTAFGTEETRGDCELSGSVTDIYRDVDGNRRLSAGDSLGMVAHSCREWDDAGMQHTTTGAVSATVTQADGIIFYLGNDRWMLNTRQNYQDLAVTYPSYSFRWNGFAEASDSAARSVARFDNLVQQSVTTQTAVIRAISGEVHRDFAKDLNKTLTSLLFKELTLRTNLVGTAEVLATIPGESRIVFDPKGSVPVSGEIRVRVGNDVVTIVVTGLDAVRVDLDLKGDGTVEGSRALTWTAMVNNAIL